jgi:hydroxymethylpyrimidine pyrophosphatase-like HAD family hydrolase
MRPLSPAASPQFVLSFDFDGTIHHPADTPSVDPGFFDLIRKLRDERQAVWGINTGRSMAHVVEGLIESRFPFTPDWVVAREREIWFPNNFGRWIGKDDWNKTCKKDHKRFFKKTRKLLKAIRHDLEEHTGATWVEQEDDPAALVARTGEEMDWIVERIRTLAAPEPLLHWQRNSIWLRFSHRDYHKGSSLRELARHYSLDPAHSFAIGDSHNDLDMLHPETAAMIACPANAVPDIQNHVTTHRGLVCKEAHSKGCIEALEHFLA